MSYPSHGSVVGWAPALGIACFTSAIVASNICLIAKPHGQKGHPEARQACVPLAKHLASPLLSTPMGGDFSCSFLPFITHPDRRSFLLTALEEFWDHLVFCPITFPLVVSLSALTTLLLPVPYLKGSLQGWTRCSSQVGNNIAKDRRAASHILYIIFLFIHPRIMAPAFFSPTADTVSPLKLSASARPVIHSDHRSFSPKLLLIFFLLLSLHSSLFLLKHGTLHLSLSNSILCIF